jgi:uncharacterized protein YdcH (DUF465 family)
MYVCVCVFIFNVNPPHIQAIGNDIASVEKRIKELDQNPINDSDISADELKAKNSRLKQRMVAAEVLIDNLNA